MFILFFLLFLLYKRIKINSSYFIIYRIIAVNIAVNMQNNYSQLQLYNTLPPTPLFANIHPELYSSDFFFWDVISKDLKEMGTSWEGVKMEAFNRLGWGRSVHSCVGLSRLGAAVSYY